MNFHACVSHIPPTINFLCAVCRTTRVTLKRTIPPSVVSPMIRLKSVKVGLRPQTKVSSGER